MAFDDKQQKALRAKLSYRNVKTRSQNGSTLHYIEGWRSIAEANRIFGYDAWDRQTMAPECLWSEHRGRQLACLYSSKVRISVRAGPLVIVREGIGTGLGRSEHAEAAHEIAIKAAETDATKRALATFGNPFGLALYDKDQSQVTKPTTKHLEVEEPLAKRNAASSELVLILSKARSERFAACDAFVAACLKAVAKLKTIDAVYAFWEANLASFKALETQATTASDDTAQTIIAALKARLRALGAAAATPEKSVSRRQLAIPKERRKRDQGHLAFVARHPCLVCGRQPAQAHHVRFAQPRAMSMKVSDEYTVPLCNGHHDAVHRTGDERAWWASRCIDPLVIAERLWTATDKNQKISLAHVPDAKVIEGGRDVSASQPERQRKPNGQSSKSASNSQ